VRAALRHDERDGEQEEIPALRHRERRSGRDDPHAQRVLGDDDDSGHAFAAAVQPGDGRRPGRSPRDDSLGVDRHDVRPRGRPRRLEGDERLAASQAVLQAIATTAMRCRISRLFVFASRQLLPLRDVRGQELLVAPRTDELAAARRRADEDYRLPLALSAEADAFDRDIGLQAAAPRLGKRGGQARVRVEPELRDAAS
jgi:hypothetical protein